MADRPARRKLRLALPVPIAVALSLALGVPVATAANTSHAFSGTISGAGGSALSHPTDVAVDQTSHDFYVADQGNHRVEKFSPSGEFILMFGKSVNTARAAEPHATEAQKNVCVAGEECQAGEPSSTPGGFELPTYLAVDNSGGPSGGDVYVADTGDNIVQKFDASGHIILNWGQAGQKDGSDAIDLPIFGPLGGIVVDGSGVLHVYGLHYSSDIWKYTQSGQYIEWINASGIFTSNGFLLSVDSKLALDPISEELYELAESEVTETSVVNHYESNCRPCAPLDEFGSGSLFGPQGLDIDSTSGTVFAANSQTDNVAVFDDTRPRVTTNGPTDLTETSVTLTGTIDPAGRGNITECHFEYGFETSYGTSVPCAPDPASNPPASNFTGPTSVSAVIHVSPGTKDHFRLVASNATSVGFGLDQSFVTTQPPAIDGLRAEHLTAQTADLKALINPNGLETTYRFEYGPTLDYGQEAPAQPPLAAGYSDQTIEVELEGLTPHVVYHYRLVAENADGTTTTEDHTFSFFPPSCPNENVRQQAQSNYLPDCRAYELVSPGNAGGTQLYPGGPNTGYATSPSRLAFVGLWGTIPGSGGNPIDSNGDLYVATRTVTGWNTRYVGLPSNVAAVVGGPTMGLPGSTSETFSGQSVGAVQNNGGTPADLIQNEVLTDPQMSTFLDWNDGNIAIGGNGADLENPTPVASDAPYVWSSEGTALGRWPTNLATVPNGVHSHLNAEGEQVTVEPGGMHALDCPAARLTGDPFDNRVEYNYCPGDVTASEDLTHFVFASEWNAFAPGGQLSAPGSVYDNDTTTGTVVIASELANGDPIPAEPGDKAGNPLQIAAVSKDGSHILMAAEGTGSCGDETCSSPPCPSFTEATRCPRQDSNLYMRSNGALTFDVTRGHYVKFVGLAEDGQKVYFTTADSLTPEDTDTSVDLYMWDESTNSITLVSIGPEGEGGGDNCSSIFVQKCNVMVYRSNQPSCRAPSGIGGNCSSDSAIAAENGDIYFFSPEQLDGTRGVAGQENLYDYRNGRPQFVTTLTTGEFCLRGFCTSSPAVRMEVSPDDSHMGFLTASPITQYDNAGHLEMYRYDPPTRVVQCVSCIPDGSPPTSDVLASQDGLFMANDGRTFFSTEDALVSGDTNHGEDVYEFVDGQAQLITPGTGETASPGERVENTPGLVAVSATGTDVYFSTDNTLVRQDHNGLFLKFYDARSGGGFSAPPPNPPCEAADECHGAGNTPPTPKQNETSAELTGGNSSNVTGQSPTTKHRHHKHRRAHRHHRRRSGGGRTAR